MQPPFRLLNITFTDNTQLSIDSDGVRHTVENSNTSSINHPEVTVFKQTGGTCAEIVKRNGIEINDLTADIVESTQAYVTANNCECAQITAFNNINLEETSCGYVKSDQGNVNWINTKYKGEKSDNISAFYKVVLAYVQCSNTTISQQDTVSATNCHLSYVQASRDVILENTKATTVVSHHGSVSIKNKDLPLLPSVKITASQDIYLDRAKARHVQSFQSGVNANNCELETVSAENSVIFTNTKVKNLNLEIRSDQSGEITLDKDSSIETITISREKTPPLQACYYGDPDNGWIRGDNFYSSPGMSTGNIGHGAIGAHNGIRCKYLNGRYIPLNEIPKDILRVTIKGPEFTGKIVFKDSDGKECEGEVI